MFALRQADTGLTVAEVCREMGLSAATYYSWKQKDVGLGAPELRWLKQLEGENQLFKLLVADRSIDKQMLQDIAKKVFRPGPLATRPNTSSTPTACWPVGLAE